MIRKTIPALIKIEEKRQKETLNLIASENYVSRAVREAMGSVLTNKYSEGYPGARYYSGNSVIDAVEARARTAALKLFHLPADAWGVNVQPYSGSPANFAVYTALVPPGGTILSLELNMGGHLTHGHHVSATSTFWKFIHYQVDQTSKLLDYDTIEAIAVRERPQMIVVGYSAYARTIDFSAFRRIADKSGALLFADISHIAGLVAGGAHPSPFPNADVVMTTTHKTLRGPRGAMIIAKKAHMAAIDKAVFPGLQGGPHNHQTAAIAVALEEATGPAFRAYAKRVIQNTRALASELQKLGWNIVTGGTDTHLFLVDLDALGVDGAEAERRLERANILVNKNAIPYDKRSPSRPSGIRIGTAAITTRGLMPSHMPIIAKWMHEVVTTNRTEKIASAVTNMMKKFPLP